MDAPSQKQKCLNYKIFLIACFSSCRSFWFECTHFFLLWQMARRRGRRGRHLSLRRWDAPAQSSGESSPTKGVFMSVNATKRCLSPFSPRTSGEVRSWPALTPPCGGDLGTSQALGVTPPGCGTPCSHLPESMSSSDPWPWQPEAHGRRHGGELAGADPRLPWLPRVREGFLHSLGSWEAEHSLLWQFEMSAN